MKRYRLKLTTISESIPASGEGKGGFDNDITHINGIPFIPAKRIKGILRESALELADAGIDVKMDRIFGLSGSKNSCALTIHDGYLKDHDEIHKCVIAHKWAEEEVLGYYTVKSARTAIDKEDGVAKDHCLFVDRVLKRNLEFNFDVGLADDLQEDFKKICKVTRSFGLNRSRGFGEIKLELIARNDNAKSFDINKNLSGECVLHLKLRTDSDVFVAQSVGSSQRSERFIPGTNILGAFAALYLAEVKPEIPNKDADFRELFLSGKVSFGSANPEVNGRIYRKSPLCIQKVKDKDDVVNSLAEESEEQLKGLPAEFCGIEDGNAFYTNITTSITYHHARPDDKSIGHATEKAGEFYQFETISRDQVFVSEIYGDAENLRKLVKLLDGKSYLKIGKSRTAQYGKCLIESITMTKAETVEAGEYVYCESPMILVDSVGQFTAKDNNFTPVHISHTNIGGYLSVWNLPRIQCTALAGGSVFKVSEGFSLPLKGYGLRTAEGFGRLRPIGKNKYILKQENSTVENDIPTNSNQQELAEYIKKERVKKDILLKVYSDNRKNPCSKSFLSRIRSIVRFSENAGDLEKNRKAVKDTDSGKESMKRLEKVVDFECYKDNFKLNKFYLETHLRKLELSGRKKNDQ